MRIVHVYKDYHPPVLGGIEQTVERLARAQVRAGHAVTVLVSASGGRRTVEETLDGVRVIRCAEWGRALSAPLCPGMPGQLARLQADVFHLHFPNPTGEVSWLIIRPKGALVITYHSDIVRQKAVLPIYGPFLGAVLGAADAILATSGPQLERSPWLRRHRARCEVVPLGIDLAPFAALDRAGPEARALRARYGEPLVLFVGRLRYYKGLDVLLESWARVEGRLVIVGDGPEEARLRERHAALGLGGRVSFAGAVEQPALLAHLAAADVGVLPSTYPSEMFGLSMVEMMACGIPVVCTELGTGTSFVNQDGVTGFVVPPRDPAALAGALNRLLADPELRARLGAAGRERAQRLFSLEAMAAGVEAAYGRALARRSGSARRAASSTGRLDEA